MKRFLVIALLALALPAGADDTCPGGPAPVEDPTQVEFCWDPAEMEKFPPEKAPKPVTPPGIKAPKQSKPGEQPQPKIPKGPPSGSKATPFRPK